MNKTIALAATLAFAEAQSNGWMNNSGPSVRELSQEGYRCGCPMPAPKVPTCAQAKPVQSTGCGCQPVQCNPKPKEIAPTKVLALQCHDVTSWRTDTVTENVKRVRKVKVPMTRKVTRPKMGYKPTKAIRYRQKMVEVDQMKWETRQVQKTTYKTVSKQVKVVAPPETRVDCCNNVVPVARQNPCSCAAPVKYTTRTITKQVPVTTMVPERVQVPCKVKKMVNEPYYVTVNSPVPGTEEVEEKYFEYRDEEYTEPVKRTTRIPIVTRQCTDASGKMIKINEIDQVPLHHSGPAPETQNGSSAARIPAPTAPKQVYSQEAPAAPAADGCAKPGCKKLSVWERASLVNAPVDRNLGNGMGLVQVGVVNPRTNNAGWAKKGSMMNGQWGGAYLAEKKAEVSEDKSSDDE